MAFFLIFFLHQRALILDQFSFLRLGFLSIQLERHVSVLFHVEDLLGKFFHIMVDFIACKKSQKSTGYSTLYIIFELILVTIGFSPSRKFSNDALE